MVILGEKERSAGAVSVRARSGEQSSGLSVEKFVQLLQDKVSSRDLS